MKISNSEYECAKKWADIFDELASHVAESMKRDGGTEEAINTVVNNTLEMRDKLKNIIDAYERGFPSEL